MRLPWQLVAVAGDSMRPTLTDGDWLLVRTVRDGAAAAPGDVLLLSRPDRAELLLVKRAVRRVGAAWWVAGDNPAGSDDSRLFGPVPDALVHGRVLARYHPSPRWLGRRRP
ncbi:MAG TPA: S26 family signal peptidase [Candidatus Nanopelagicales bacterium]|nr:S26 family signal peptidase [Candidatus Nanopelagicales bacterium]